VGPRDGSAGARGAELGGQSERDLARIDRDCEHRAYCEPAKGEANLPIYRLTSHALAASGSIQLTWSPEPQTDRTFLVSGNGQPGVPQTLSGKEKMGNGTSGTSGRASATLRVGLPTQSLTIADLFPAETVVFPIDALDGRTRRELAACR
jgi:hypothetical protein